MRTPINAILTMLESLMLTNENPDQRRMCQIIKNSAKLLMYLVNDMLDVYMLRTGKFQKLFEEFNVREEVLEIYEMFFQQAQAKVIDLILIFDPTCPETVVTDVRRFKQVLINLISNALKFTMQGAISITLSYEESSNMIISTVVDTGVGINKNELTQLFKLFGKLKSNSNINRAGIGLGLNICKQIVSAFEGEIHCES